MTDQVENIGCNHVVSVDGGESITIGANRTVTVARADTVAVGTNRSSASPATIPLRWAAIRTTPSAETESIELRSRKT